MRRRYAGGGVKPGWIIIAVIAGIMMAAILGKDGQPPKEKAIIELEKQSEGQKEIGPVFINMYNHYDKVIENIELEEYVAGVVSAEMPISFGMEALKAQAVAARTLALKKARRTVEAAPSKRVRIYAPTARIARHGTVKKSAGKNGAALLMTTRLDLKKRLRKRRGLYSNMRSSRLRFFIIVRRAARRKTARMFFQRRCRIL